MRTVHAIIQPNWLRNLALATRARGYSSVGDSITTGYIAPTP